MLPPSGVPLKDIAEITAINKKHRLPCAGPFGAGKICVSRLCRRVRDWAETGTSWIGGSYQTTMRKIGRPVLEELARITGETVSLAALEGREVFYLDVMESAHTFRLVSQIGMCHPACCTALGKVMLAFHSEEEQDNLISGIEFKRLTHHTITRSANLRKELTLIRQRGYSLENEELYLGSRCIRAPIFDESDRVVAALSVSGPTTRVTREKVATFAACGPPSCRRSLKDLAANTREFMARSGTQHKISAWPAIEI
jgi:hypothetical protein